MAQLGQKSLHSYINNIHFSSVRFLYSLVAHLPFYNLNVSVCGKQDTVPFRTVSSLAITVYNVQWRYIIDKNPTLPLPSIIPLSPNWAAASRLKNPLYFRQLCLFTVQCQQLRPVLIVLELAPLMLRKIKRRQNHLGNS